MNTTDQPLGTVLREGDKTGVRYERRLGHPPEKVWRAITESEHLPRWLPCDMLGDRKEGAAIELRMKPDVVEKYEIDDPSLYGEIKVWDPPKVFEWTWDVDVLRFELEPTDEGTLLTLVTWFNSTDAEYYEAASGFHLCLGSLIELLDTGDATKTVDIDPKPMEARYQELF